ncbi:LysR family transcriptional regulator [Pseudoprimorskyibacter insulae]|nr:LysR family transcriptional regulator [Pseudoprimorskyibacter insulae]
MLLLIHLFELRNMKRAAEAMGMSQPAVSLTISELEKLLGVDLFQRHARGVDPTAVTTELIPVARRIIAAIGDGSEVVANVVNENAGFLRISSPPGAISSLLLPMIADFGRRHPKVHVEITETSASNPLHAISDGICDILFMRRASIIPEGWEFVECIEDPLVVVCGAQNALARKGHISPEELARANWLVSRRGSIARQRLEELAEEIDLPPENRFSVVTHVSILTLNFLTTSDVLTLIPRGVAAPWLRDGRVVELDCMATTPLPPLGLLTRSDDARQVTGLFIRELKTHLGRAQSGRNPH